MNTIQINYITRIFFVGCVCFFIGACAFGTDSNSLPMKSPLIKFYNLTWAASLNVEEKENLELQWSMGIDASGVGIRCSSENDKICVKLDGLWAFSLPKIYIEHPDLSHSWDFMGIEFIIDSIVRIPLAAGKYEEALLIASYAKNKQSVIFLYSKNRGILYILEIDDNCKKTEIECLENLVDKPARSIWTSNGWRLE